ncbi:actin-binding protein, putative [Candida dubliniensis CD36]|uniref:Actin-binding protein, putative n=1 Tax=Candida dubliniensis (strain CD36 / ATCC MYA-646 / CBS 7987 / NCPF 3949 / NRRL Y-17841) TaxID=573826 RepID=B9WFY9_CANDC|nr:actin-binding protein, putative [Candida dubliniensis CD36]CAX42158.1 actin-binding protein, putative [Candida dubliniensis CD36]
MEKIDFNTNSNKIQQAYDKVVRGDPNATYVVYSVDKNATMDVTETGDGSLEDFVEHFTDGQVQFGLARVTVPGSDVSKNILLGWCPDSAPAKLRLSFANNFADVSRVLNGYHVQITARDQDDLDVNEFLNRVGAAAGARYSTQSSGTKKPTPVAPKPVSKPVVAKPSTGSKPSFVPKSTGKPIAPVKPKPKSITKDAGWGDAEDIEERDFDKKPLENVPSAYKPTKVNIDDLRKQKSDTTSSTPKAFKPEPTEEKNNDEEQPKPLSERMKAYNQPSSSDGRLTSLPKPKIGHSVADKYKANAPGNGGAPVFGAKPVFGTQSVDSRKDKLVGGLSRDFGAENGKTPAQIWAEKRGKYKTVASDEKETNSNENVDEPEEHHTADLAKKFEEKAKIVDDTPSLPTRNLPPAPPARETTHQSSEKEEEEEDAPAPSLPVRNLPPPPQRQSEPEPEPEKEEAAALAPSLPARNTPSAPKAEETKKQSVTATAEYDYEKDEDNEIGFSEGDLIIDIEFVDDDWWQGKHAETGEVGLFPATYVSLNEKSADKEEEEEEEEAPAPSLPSREGTQAPPALPSRSEQKPASKTATAEYDYEKDEDNEIGFAEGDLIIEIEFVDDDWWQGKHSKTGEVGLFPANYVVLNE